MYALFSATLIIGVITFSNTMEQITFQIIELNLHVWVFFCDVFSKMFEKTLFIILI